MKMFTMLSIWPSTVEGWVGLITLLIGLISAISALVPTALALFKKVKELIKEKDWAKIMKIAEIATKAAETTGGSSEEKEQMAIDIIKAECEEMHIEMNEETLKEVIAYIKELIDYFNGMTKASKEGKKAKLAKNKAKEE